MKKGEEEHFLESELSPCSVELSKIHNGPTFNKHVFNYYHISDTRLGAVNMIMNTTLSFPQEP